MPQVVIDGEAVAVGDLPKSDVMEFLKEKENKQ